MKIHIKLLSDMCTYSGETYNSMVDMDVVYDAYGIPYIPAKRIKGCIREAALELQEFGLISASEYERLFGKEGNCQTAFSLSNAYLKEYPALLAIAEHYKGTELTAPQNLLEQYTATRTQTAVDLETGVADKNSLRTMRVVRRGLEFDAECHLNRDADEELLRRAVSLVKHMGVSRSRGLGLVQMTLEGSDAEDKNTQNRHVQITKDQLGEQNRISYRITLKSTMICKSAQGNQAETQDYISGGKVLGLLAGALGAQEYRNLMQQHTVRVSNAYIMNGEKRCLPARISLQKEKDQSYASDGSMQIKDMLYAPDIKGKQMTPAGVDYMDADHHTAGVETEISYHHQRPDDKSVGRATGEDGSSFYQLCGISAGQSFGGFIYADRESAEKIMDAVSKLGEVRMGYGKSSEFGAVEFVLDGVTDAESSEELMHDAVVTLASDVILYNESGMPSTELNVLKSYLEDMTGVSDLELTQPFLQFALIGGFNVTWNRRKPAFHAFGKGSTFLLHSDTGFDGALLQSKFVGERTAEGYGELLLTKKESTADLCIYKPAEADTQILTESEDTDRVLQELLQAEFARQMEQMIRTIVQESRTKFAGKGTAGVKGGLNASIAKLRVIFKNEATYEKMKEQVNGIEDKTKKQTCLSIVSLLVPEALEEEITERIRQQYQVTFTSQWDVDRLYRNVYRIGLTELKYFVKSLGKAEKEG